jgi:hypothetical protein
MILGIIIIVFAGLLNALLVLLPMLIMRLIHWGVVSYLYHLKIRSDRVDFLSGVALDTFGVVMASCLQIWVWKLIPGTDAWLWILAVTTYAIGGLMILLVVIPHTTNPFERATASQRFMISSLICMALLAVAFRVPEVHVRLKQLPVDVATFVFGGKSNG